MLLKYNHGIVFGWNGGGGVWGCDEVGIVGLFITN